MNIDVYMIEDIVLSFQTGIMVPLTDRSSEGSTAVALMFC